MTPQAHPSDSLLPCPFCAGTAISEHFQEGSSAGTYFWHVCSNCGAQTEGSHGQGEAIAAWNRRALAAPGGEGEVCLRERYAEDRDVCGCAKCEPSPPEPVAWRPDRAETGWLVESDDKGPLYHTASSTTRDASKALRFSRQQDADAFIKAHGPNHYSSVSTPAWRAVEHRWG